MESPKQKKLRQAARRARERAYLDMLADSIDEAEPLAPGTLARTRLLIDGVHVDLDLPLDPNDD
jgi:hypothetical protein